MEPAVHIPFRRKRKGPITRRIIKLKSELVIAVNQICSERNLSQEIIIEAIETALVSAYKKNFGGGQNITAKIDMQTGVPSVFLERIAVQEVKDERFEISLPEARKIVTDAEEGSLIQTDITPDSFGRIAAQTAKQVILQRIREAERDALFSSYADREGELINGMVASINPHAITLNLGRTEAIMPRSQQVPGERYRIGQRVRAYVMEVRRTSRGPQIVVSRTHSRMLRRLLELEVPEIFSGTVEIKSISREAGSRSKVAVAALQDGIDPVGSCVGIRGMRIQSIVRELGGEKIDVVEWSADDQTFISNALSPAKVNYVVLSSQPNNKTATVVVPDDQLSLAIGKEGQNARLAAKLTNWRIDIKSASEAITEDLRPRAEAAHTLEGQKDILAMAEAILLGKKPAQEEKEKEPEETLAPEPEIAAEVETAPEEAVEELVSETQAPELEKEEHKELAPEPEPEPALEVQETKEPEERAPEPEPEPETTPVAPRRPQTRQKQYEYVSDEEFDSSETTRKKARRKRRRLIYNEEAGEVVVERRHKRRDSPGDYDWEEYLDR